MSVKNVLMDRSKIDGDCRICSKKFVCKEKCDKFKEAWNEAMRQLSEEYYAEQENESND